MSDGSIGQGLLDTIIKIVVWLIKLCWKIIKWIFQKIVSFFNDEPITEDLAVVYAPKHTALFNVGTQSELVAGYYSQKDMEADLKKMTSEFKDKEDLWDECLTRIMVSLLLSRDLSMPEKAKIINDTDKKIRDYHTDTEEGRKDYDRFYLNVLVVSLRILNKLPHFFGFSIMHELEDDNKKGEYKDMGYYIGNIMFLVDSLRTGNRVIEYDRNFVRQLNLPNWWHM